MRKSLIALLLLAALSAGGFAAAHAALLSRRDNVTITQEVLYGDVSAADGLELTIPVNYNDMQFWTTTYAPGSSPAVGTEYEIEPLGKRVRHGTITYGGLRLLNDWHFRFVPGQEPPQPSLYAAYQELYESTAPGEEQQKLIRPADYCAYYPLSFRFDLPQYHYRWDPGDYRQPEAEITPIIQALRDFFRIPVQPAETWNVHLERSASASGTLSSWGSSYGPDDHIFEFDTACAMTEDACYLAFDAHDYDGKTVDTSLIPGGYGIYRLPLDQEHIKHNDLSGIKADELEMVYAMDPRHTLYDLTLSPDGRRLLLHTREDGNYVLTVIDPATMEQVRRFEVPTAEGRFVLYPQDGFFAVQTDPNLLSVFAPDGSGEYGLALTTEVCPEGGPVFSPSDHFRLDTAPMAWDGERLAIFAQQYATSLYCELSFLLGVYDAGGTAYLGSYRNSLEPPGVEGLRSQLDSRDPPVLRWTK